MARRIRRDGPPPVYTSASWDALSRWVEANGSASARRSLEELEGSGLRAFAKVDQMLGALPPEHRRSALAAIDFRAAFSG